MKRRRNWLVWIGFVTALIAALSYIPVFSRFPLTRDVPWVNLALFAIAGVALGVGVYRAFAQSTIYRGKISAPILTLVSLGIFSLFAYGIFVEARRIPSGASALRPQAQAPDFTLHDTKGNPVSLSALCEQSRAVLLIFYRGYW